MVSLAAVAVVVFTARRIGAVAPIWIAAVLASGAFVLGAALTYIAVRMRLVRADEATRKLLDEMSALNGKARQGLSVIASTPNGVVSVDCDGVITLCNPAAERTFGKYEQAVVGKKIEDADLHPELARLSYDCISSEANLSSEIRLPGWPVRVLGVRAVSLGRKVPGSDCVMLVIQDLSDIRRRQMREREFVSNVSHELRTPITAVLTTTEALIGGAKNDPDVVDRFLGTIMSESKRLSTLIEDLLEVTRRDYGMVVRKSSRVLVDELLERAISAVRPQAGVKCIGITVNVPEGTIAYADETQMVRLVRNLVDNAVKYTSDGGQVRVAAHQDGEELVLSVADTGMGIPQGEVERIFERFYRVDKARSRRMGGTGLGLAIVKDIVDSCGGRIEVETQLGVGSTFVVRLPIRQEAQEPDEPVV